MAEAHPTQSTRSAHEAVFRDFILHSVLLLLVLAALFPRTFFMGETALPAALLFEVPPWNAHVPRELRPYQNSPAIEAFILFNMYYEVSKAAIESGEWPLWNPLEFGGIPLLANYQSAVFYPPRLLHAVLDVPIASTLFILLKFWLCGMTMYGCARTLGLQRPSATFASLGWMLSGYHMSWAYHAIPDISAWLPLLLIGVEFLLLGRTRRGFLVTTVAAVMLLLAGHPESAFTGSLAVGMYFFLRIALGPGIVGRVRTAVSSAAGAWAVALLVSSAQILPFLEYLTQSQTYMHRVVDEASLHFMSAGLYPVLVVPRYFGSQADGAFWADGVNVSSFATMMYAGIPALLGVGLLFSRGHSDRTRSRRILALAAPAVIFFLLAFRIPGTHWLLELPLLHSTWGSWFLVYPMMALPLLGAMGLEHWLSRPRRYLEFAPILAITAMVSTAILIRFGIDWRILEMQGRIDYVARQLLIAGVLTCMFLVVCLGAIIQQRSGWVLVALTVLLVADLLVAARGLVGTSPRAAVLMETRLIRHLQDISPPARISTMYAGIHTGLLQPFGIEELWAYDGILPDRMWTFLGNIGGGERDRLEPLTSTEWYLYLPAVASEQGARKLTGLTFVESVDGIDLYRSERAFPRAFLVGHVESVADPTELFERLRDPAFDPRSAALVEGLPPHAVVAEGSHQGTAEIVQRTSTTASVEVNANADSVLVITDAYYPGWRAYLNGRPTAVFPAYHAFRGVQVPRGTHRVEFRYEPTSFRLGMLISSTTLSGGLLLTLWMVYRRRMEVCGGSGKNRR